jgi:hypothetical protein
LKKYFSSAIALLALSVVLISWGGVGHSKISASAALSFNTEMQDFNTWVDFLRDHASDADTRKGGDPTEGPKHYIDIDNYNLFITTGRIPQTLDSVNNLYGAAAVLDNGILPWATKASFDSLRNCFQRHDFTKAKIFAADLGHYVADGHMPLHITKNYNGQLTGATGIHSRYESTMISAYISQITYSGENISKISDVNQYIFDYLYNNYTYVDSVLMADTYAKSISGGSTSSTAYKTALWNKSKGFTIPLFKRASHALAEMIYTAWVQAGSPSLISTTSLDTKALNNDKLEQNTPNPFSVSTKFNFTLTENSKVLVQVNDINGNAIATLYDEMLAEGKHTCEWTPDNVPAGIYYLVMKTGNYTQVKKMVYSCGM